MTVALTTSPLERSRSDPSQDRDLVHLRHLLLNDDRRHSAAIKAELSRLDQRLGTDDRLCRAIADQLVTALKVAEVENHRGLAAVMAPIVLSGIRREIVESRDVMVEALYPITGRLVSAAVGAAMKQLSEDINRKLEASLSPRQVQLRLKALVTRQPLSDLVLADAARGRLERLILIDRATGAVLAATDADGRDEPEPDNNLNLLGGLVSAIVQFAGHALAETQGELRQLDFGGQTILLRASPLFILAAITATGTPNARLPITVDAAFLGFLEDLQSESSNGQAAALADLHGRVANESAPAKTSSKLSPLKVVAGLLAILVAYGVGHVWMKTRKQHDETIALASIERLPAFDGYPLDLSFDRETTAIRARGILPTRAEADLLRDKVTAAFPRWAFEPRVAVVSETPLARATDTALRDQSARTSQLEKTLTIATTALAGLRAEVGDRAELSDNETQALVAGQTTQDRRAADLETRLARTMKALDDVRAEVGHKAELSDNKTQVLVAGQTNQDRRAADLETRLASAMKALDDVRAQMTANNRAADSKIAALTAAEGAEAKRASELQGALNAATKALTDLRAEVLQGARAAEVAGRTTQALIAAQTHESETTRHTLDRLAARIDTPLDRLEASIRTSAVFFDAGASYHDPERAARDLGRLADALKAVPDARLRVVGYGDGVGSIKGNQDAARARAEHVVADLEQLGIESKRLKVLATRSPNPITDEAGNGANRRAVFELAFASE